jgi:hypothetical protein
MQAAFEPIADDLTCDLCKEGLAQRLGDVVTQWGSVRVSLPLIYEYVSSIAHYKLAAVHHLMIASLNPAYTTTIKRRYSETCNY